MNILITGATGFLGRALTTALERQGGHRIVGVHSRNGDLTRAESLGALPPLKYDRVYHLAAWTQAGDFCLTHPGEQWIINQKINTHVLDWWRQEQPQAKMIGIGTSCSYGEQGPMDEESYLVGQPTPSLYTYAMTKRMLYMGLVALHKQFGMSYLHLVPSTLYGPGYHEDGRQAHFIFDLIRKIMRGKHLGERVVLWGDGHQRRELVYIDDFVAAMLRLTDACANQTVNIGAGEDFSIREFAGRICDITGFDAGLIEYDTGRYVGARSKLLRVDRLKGLLPDLRLTPLEVGLRTTIAWFQERPERFLGPLLR